jgi:hypothetical protein
MLPLKLLESNVSIVYINNCKILNKSAVKVDVQNGDHWHQYIFGTVQLGSHSQIKLFEEIQQHVLQ